MGLFDLFRNKQEDESLCLIRDMIAMSVADGEVTPEEANFLESIMAEKGIDFDLYAHKLSNPYLVRDAYPKTYDEKMDYLKRVVALMMVDGECAPEEIRFCNIVARKMSLGERSVGECVAYLAAHAYAYGIDKSMDMVITYIANGGYYPEDKK